MALPLFSKKNADGSEMGFFDHIEALRGHILRSVAYILILAVVVFYFKEILFDYVLFGPKKPDFFTYRLLAQISQWLFHDNSIALHPPTFKVISTSLSGQFMMHMTMSFLFGFILALPLVLWEFWRFVSPALYEKEQKAITGVVFYSTMLFLLGALFGYYLLTPFSIAFLSDYSISSEVVNMIALDEYLNFLTMMILATGLTFELPMVMYFLSKLGIVNSKMLAQFRKYAVVLVLILAAVITPSVDMFTQLLVSIPIYALYEASIIIARRVERNKALEE